MLNLIAKLDSTITSLHERRIAALMVVASAALAVLFSLGPIFEGPDEIEHFRYIRILAQTGHFPDPYSQPESELFQTPLYYLLTTPLVLVSSDAGFENIDGRRNPYHGYEIGIPGNDNKNFYLHTRAEAFPYREGGVARTVHLIRLLSVLIGASTLATSYAVFKYLWPDRPDRRLAALGFLAFLPQFVYLSSVVTNDILLCLLMTLSLLFLLRQNHDGPTWRGALLLGVTLGATLLTEMSAGLLVIPVAVATLLDRRTWRYAPLTLGVTLGVAGWWYLRNIRLYGDPFGFDALFSSWPSDVIEQGHPSLTTGLTQLPYAYRGFWARFGYGAVAVGKPLHWFFDALTIATLSGFVVWLITTLRGARWRTVGKLTTRQTLIASSFLLAWIGGASYISAVVFTGNTGREFLPALAVWGALIALGTDQWTPNRFRMAFALGGATLMAGATLVSLFGYFFPAYKVLPVPTTIEHPLSYRYENLAEITGIDSPDLHTRPGEEVRLTLYWHALRPTDGELQAYLHTQDTDVVRRDSHPATGNLLSTDWYAGQTWAETYVIVIPPDAEEQVAYPLVAGLYDPQTDVILPAEDSDGNNITPIVGRIVINGSQQPFASDYRLGGSIGLAEPVITRNGTEAELCLHWQSLAPVAIDYHVFVHVLSSDGEIITQADVEPKDGAYPTGAWSPGESIEDCIVLDFSDIPPDGWQIGVGLYDLESEQRLPVVNAKGEPVVNDMVLFSG